MTLQGRLLLLVLLSLLPVGAIDIYNAVALQRAGEADVRRDALSLAQQIRDEQERLIEGVRQVLVLAASNTRIVREGDYPACAGMMAALRARVPGLSQPPGHRPRRGCPVRHHRQRRDRPSRQEILAGDHRYRPLLVVGGYILSKRDARPILPFALAYRDTSETTAGAVVAALDASWLKTTWPASRSGLTRASLSRTVTGPSWPGNRIRLLWLARSCRNGSTASSGPRLRASPDWRVRLVRTGFSDMCRSGRRRACSSPSGVNEKIALAPAREAMVRSFGLLGSVLALLPCWRRGGEDVSSIQKPVATLVDTARRWQAGNRAARTGMPIGASEISTLGHAFDEMAASIQEREAASVEAALALSESEARCRSIVETAIDAMVVIDERGTVQSFNPAAVQIFGYPADQVIGGNVSMLMPEPHHSAHDGYLEYYRRTGERKIISIGREVEGRRLDGSTFPLELAIAEWRVGDQRYFTGIMRDITQRKEAERELVRAKETAEEASIAKSRFLASASHDLRQPMQSLFFFASALERHIGSAEGRENLMHLERGLDALKGLLDSLLDISRLDAGAVNPVVEDFPVSVLLDHIAVAYAPVADGKGIGLLVVPTKAWVRSDRILLGRIVRNLVENAVRYTEHGRVLVDCLPRGERLRIEVRDSGIGIPSEHIEQIWDEFHQVGNPERDRTQGLGLGLTIVKRIAGILGCSVDVRSSPEEGSVFAIEVPLGEAKPEFAPAGKPVRPVSANENADGKFAVLVDDDAIVLLGLQMLMKQLGYKVIIAASTEQAIGNCAKSPQSRISSLRTTACAKARSARRPFCGYASSSAPKFPASS